MGKVRQSNFELLRIIAMLLVLIVHADYLSIGSPTVQDATDFPLPTFMRITTQSLSIVCVNVYILISGFFLIKLTKRRFFNLIFMIEFWRVFILLLFYITNKWFSLGEIQLTGKQILLYLIPGEGDWFVQAYILLMLLSPLLNSFIDNSSTKQIAKFTCIWIIFQFCFNWLSHVYNMFEHGYSILSFIGLYTLGALISKERTQFKFGWKTYLSSYLGFSIFIGLIVLILLSLNSPVKLGQIINALSCDYNGLIVLTSSLLFFLSFMKMNFKNKFINSIAVSCFAVYLVHMNPLIRGLYIKICRNIYDTYNGLDYLMIISLFIIGVYVVTILLDRIRIVSFSFILRFLKMTLNRFRIH